ncbi:MAG: copper amine oxidase N-terminal domain-containing protein, partial [Tissierellia bacterium]|nr:copper amine oxidase N-terminal domain-containing protein [Tissierellia bacterium]
MKKKLFLLILVLVLMIPVVTSAQEQPIKLVVHGNNVETDVAPFIENGRTLVPVRVISETLGFKVQWIAEEEKVV